MYDLMRVRLWSAGPPGALFNNVIIDLRDSLTDVSGSDGSNERAAAARPARRIAVVGPYGAGKSTLVRLISSVFVQAQPLPGARLVPLEVEQRVGHVALEWRHPRTGDLLITGRVLRHRPEAPVGRTLAWYSFRLTATSGLESLPFAHDAPSEGLRSFRERLEAALPPD